MHLIIPPPPPPTTKFCQDAQLHHRVNCGVPLTIYCQSSEYVQRALKALKFVALVMMIDDTSTPGVGSSRQANLWPQLNHKTSRTTKFCQDAELHHRVNCGVPLTIEHVQRALKALKFVASVMMIDDTSTPSVGSSRRANLWPQLNHNRI